MLSVINAYIIATSRVIQSISTRFRIPRGRSDPQGTPAYALIVGCGISAALLLGSNHFDELAIISVITILIPYIFCIAAWIIVRDTRSRIVSAVGALSKAAIRVMWFFVH